MRNSTYLKMGLNMLVHSKLRSWLTIIGIVIGIGSVVGILSLGDAMEEQVQSRLAEMDLTKITISPGYTKASSNMPGPGGGGPGGTTTDVELTDDDIDALQGLDGIEYIAGQISGSEPVIYSGENATLTITGVDPQVWQYMTTLETESGRLLEPSDKYVAVIGSGVATETYDQEIGINQVITINGKSVRVVGILTEEGQGDRSLYMPIDAAVNLIDDAEDDVYDTITVKAKSEDLVDGLMEDIEDKLMISRGIIQEDDQDFSVSASKSMAESVTEMTSPMTLFLGAIAAVSLIVGAVGIANTMFTSVLEKTKEIGTMKAIGAKNRDILMIFLFNSAMVGLVGGVLGVILGAFVSTLFPYLGMTMMGGGGSSGISLAPDLMAFGLILAIVIGVASGVVPAYRASKLKPVDALRYE
ncbi:MAG: putative transport system permease protein [Euryarchaeota archaeon]|nr:putative transport system permease protein [Euryarchaeota archaeon]